MKEVTVLVDTSGSMNVLGKIAICDDLLKFLYLFPLINSCEDRLSFIQQAWDGSDEELNKICKEITSCVLLTDGYICDDCKSTLRNFSLDTSKKIVIVLVGSDSYMDMETTKKTVVYSAADIDTVATYFARH